ncbi:hypothetical protein OC861_005172 [Tilletia horrida]|nr:hypothetical protein OC861_005172 [Tilletia horrida]
MPEGSGDVGNLPSLRLEEDLADDLFRRLNAGNGPAGKGRTTKRHRDHSQVKRSQCSYLAWSFILVLLKIRDAVLIDQVPLSYAQQIVVLEAFHGSPFGASLTRDVVFLSHQPTGQVFLLHRPSVRRRAQRSLTPSTPISSPAFVSVDARLPVGSRVDRNDTFTNAALQQLSELPEAGGIFQLRTPTHAAVAFAGWLLDYAVIYRFEHPGPGLTAASPDASVSLCLVESQDEVSLNEDAFWEAARPNNLASQPLRLFRVALETRSNSTPSRIDLYSFTCPVAAFDVSSQDTRPDLLSSAETLREAIQTDVAQRLRSALDILKTCRSNSQKGHTKSADHALDELPDFLSDARVLVTHSEVSLPQVAL